MSLLSDEELLILLRHPSTIEKGFRQLMHKYQEKMYWHIRRIVGSHDDTDDVIQNTFIKAFRAIATFEERSSLYTWLYRIATNEALSHLKSKKAKSTLSIDDQYHGLEEDLLRILIMKLLLKNSIKLWKNCLKNRELYLFAVLRRNELSRHV